MLEVWASYGTAFAHIAGNFIFAVVIVCVVRHYCALRASPRIQSILILLGTAALLTAGLGRLGWSIQSWAGTTPPEILDRCLVRALSHLGMFLIFSEWCWAFVARTDDQHGGSR